MADVSSLMKMARKRSKEEKAASQARFKEILAIVKKYDLKDGLTPETAVNLIQDLGTTFVKLGQIASTHPDVLPVEYCEALGALRTHARALDFADVKAQVESELGKPMDELFAEFDEAPLGSASIAQVHRAVLPSGEIVAVKVQRPGIVETVTEDLAILERLVDILDLVPDETWGRLFTRAAKAGMGIELNLSMRSLKSDEERPRVFRPYRIARECGCTFYLGSDAHHPVELEGALARFTAIVDGLGLEEKDKFPLVR